MNAYNDGKAKAQKANKYDAKYNAVKPSVGIFGDAGACLLYTSPSPRDATLSRMPSSA